MHGREGDFARIVAVIQGKYIALDDQNAIFAAPCGGSRARQEIRKWARRERIQTMIHAVAIDVQQLPLFGR